jgi:hypothetical protein
VIFQFDVNIPGDSDDEIIVTALPVVGTFSEFACDTNLDNILKNPLYKNTEGNKQIVEISTSLFIAASRYYCIVKMPINNSTVENSTSA